jgi:hypothetical protein
LANMLNIWQLLLENLTSFGILIYNNDKKGDIHVKAYRYSTIYCSCCWM